MQNIVVIWDQLGQEPLRFFVTQNRGFWRWIVCTSTPTLKTLPPKPKLAELCALMYDDDGNCKQTLLDAFPCEAVWR